MAFEFRGVDARGVPQYTGGEEPPSPLVCGIWLLVGGAILFLFLICGLIGIENGEPGRLLAAIACGFPLFLLLLCGYQGWMRVSLALPFLRPLADHHRIKDQPEPRLNLDGEDLYDPAALPDTSKLLRPADPGDICLRSVQPAVPAAEHLLHPSESGGHGTNA